MAETLLMCVVLLVGFVVVFAVDAHGKARAFEHGRVDTLANRPPETLSDIELPPPHFDRGDPDQRGSGAL